MRSFFASYSQMPNFATPGMDQPSTQGWRAVVAGGEKSGSSLPSVKQGGGADG